MILEVVHNTTYAYSRPVTLTAHSLRFRPRSDGTQRLLDHRLEVSPEPSQVAEFLDVEGNSVTQAWFDGATSSLEITMRARVETLLTNPHRVYLAPEAQTVPVRERPDPSPILRAYLSGPPVAGDVEAYAKAVAATSEWRLQPFLNNLTARIHEDFPSIVRMEGGPWSALETLRRREGACRDLTVLFMDACRSLGIAARFVSGYHLGTRERDRWDLHAWPEVYLPDAGWRGFDPTVGWAVADRHVAVAAAHDPQHTAPVAGSFVGDASSSISARVHVSAVGE